MAKCFYCTYKTDPVFTDVDNLEKFVSARRKILSSERSGACAKHQRKISEAIKRARFMGLLPFIAAQADKVRQHSTQYQD